MADEETGATDVVQRLPDVRGDFTAWWEFGASQPVRDNSGSGHVDLLASLVSNVHYPCPDRGFQ